MNYKGGFVKKGIILEHGEPIIPLSKNFSDKSNVNIVINNIVDLDLKKIQEIADELQNCCQR